MPAFRNGARRGTHISARTTRRAFGVWGRASRGWLLLAARLPCPILWGSGRENVALTDLSSSTGGCSQRPTLPNHGRSEPLARATLSAEPEGPNPMPLPSLELDRLLKLRLSIARFGEMDLARWWNTRGQLGGLGAAALRRGFPRTHSFAQARSVFAVAAHRCAEVFEPPNCVTIWRLPETVEEEFDARWEHWLDNASDWAAFFRKLEGLQGTDLVATLRAFEVVGERDVEAFSRLRRSAEGRAVPLPGVFSGTNEEVALLALGFARGEIGALAVPYARRGDA